MQMTSIPYDNRKPSAIKVTFIQKESIFEGPLLKSNDKPTINPPFKTLFMGFFSFAMGRQGGPFHFD